MIKTYLDRAGAILYHSVPADFCMVGGSSSILQCSALNPPVSLNPGCCCISPSTVVAQGITGARKPCAPLQSWEILQLGNVWDKWRKAATLGKEELQSCSGYLLCSPTLRRGDSRASGHCSPVVSPAQGESTMACRHGDFEPL